MVMKKNPCLQKRQGFFLLNTVNKKGSYSTNGQFADFNQVS